jgi:hypothetical protein
MYLYINFSFITFSFYAAHLKDLRPNLLMSKVFGSSD